MMRGFWRKGTYSLRKEIALVIIIKLILIFIIWFTCFSNPISDRLTTESMQKHIFGNMNKK